MAANPKVTHVEFDLDGEGPSFQTWVTVRWGDDDEMQVDVGKTDPKNLDIEVLARKATQALRKIAKNLNNVEVEAI